MNGLARDWLFRNAADGQVGGFTLLCLSGLMTTVGITMTREELLSINKTFKHFVWDKSVSSNCICTALILFCGTVFVCYMSQQNVAKLMKQTKPELVGIFTSYG